MAHLECVFEANSNRSGSESRAKMIIFSTKLTGGNISASITGEVVHKMLHKLAFFGDLQIHIQPVCWVHTIPVTYRIGRKTFLEAGTNCRINKNWDLTHSFHSHIHKEILFFIPIAEEVIEVDKLQ